jgi:hypothetical protein
MVLAGIALMALTVGLLGQLSEEKGSYFEKNIEAVSYANANPAEHSWIEDWMALPFEKELYEKELSMEAWMMTPFEAVVGEVDMNVESWMNIPFEVVDESGIESWMKVPFEVEEATVIENWMTIDWI